MTRTERIAAAALWDTSFALEVAGARRRTLRRCMRAKKIPTLRDLLALIGEDLCDLVDTPTAGQIRIGDLVGRDGEGSMLAHVLAGLGLGSDAPLEDAVRLELRELDSPLVDLLD